MKSSHCAFGEHERCLDGAALFTCSCTCGHPGMNPAPEWPKTCICGFVMESYAVQSFHAAVDHDNVTAYRRDTDEWVIDLGDDALLPFTEEKAWRLACAELGLGDPVEDAKWELA